LKLFSSLGTRVWILGWNRRFDTQCWMPFLAPLSHLSWLKNLCPNSILSCLGTQLYLFVCYTLPFSIIQPKQKSNLYYVNKIRSNVYHHNKTDFFFYLNLIASVVKKKITSSLTMTWTRFILFTLIFFS
jgi:hypothetical protein